MASKTAILMARGWPSSPRAREALTRTGSRVPSAWTSSSATSWTWSCMSSIGREVGLVVDPATDGEQVGEGRHADQLGGLAPDQVRNVALVLTMTPSGVVVRKPQGADS